MSFLNVAKRIDFLDAEIKRLEDEKRELISRQQRACSHPSDERESDGYYQSWEQNWVNLGWRCKICGLYQKERAE